MDTRMILIIDFNNMFFGSWFGDPLINSRGMNVNAIKAFFFKVKSLKDSIDPDYIVFANDLGRDHTFRRRLYKGYKAQRKPLDMDIIDQRKEAIRISNLMGYPLIGHELYEADDIIGMISKYATENGMNTIISSTDRDLYQLVNENVAIISPKSREFIDPGWIYEKYRLTPSQWIELKILQGDRSDNIPGIDGIGEVTALKLLHQYHSIENIYANLHHIRESIRNALKDGIDRLPLIRELVTIVTDYTKIDFNLSMIEHHEIYRDELFTLLRELELYSLYDIMNYSLLLGRIR